MDKFFAFAGISVAVVALALVVTLVLSVPVWLLWNYCLVGAVAGVAELTWSQSWGILILCNILFKSNVSKKD